MDTSQDNPYTYHALETPTTIRLLHLAPGRDDEVLSGELCHAKLHPEQDVATGHLAPAPLEHLLPYTPSFEAISYVWGAPEFTRSMISSGGRIFLTPNLEEALRAIRLPDRVRVLWADAICIHQNDAEERGQQVRLMDKIYAGTHKVLIWLGQDLHNIASRTFATIVDSPTPYHATHHGEDVFDAVCTVTKAEWFSRLWVVQELWLSQQAVLMWGKEQMNFEELRCRTQGSMTNRTSINHSWILSSGRRRDIITVLTWLRTMHCSDARDRIYAIRGLPYDPESKISQAICNIAPDYTTSAGQLFLNVACLFVQYDEVPTLLSFVNHPPDRTNHTEDLPSWIPDWSYSVEFSPFNERGKNVLATIVTLAKEQPTVLRERQMLAIVGFTSDVIGNTSKDLASHSLSVSIEHVLEFWTLNIKPLEKSLSAYTYAQLETTFMHTLSTRGEWAQKKVNWEFLSSALFAPAALKGRISPYWLDIPGAEMMVESLRRSVRLTNEEPPYSGVPTFYSVRKPWANRKLFRTSNGRLGLGPVTMKSADTVVVLSNVKRPAILRYQDGCWTFIGLAFIAAYSKEEVLRMWDAKDKRVELFKLR